MRITQEEIAEIAEVSRGTVDRVLHNRPGVNKDVRLRVNNIIKALDYTPNVAGQALVCRKRNLFFGVMISPNIQTSIEEVRREVFIQVEELRAWGIELNIEVTTASNASEQLKQLDCLLKQGIDGIAIAQVFEKSVAEKLNELMANGIPVITFYQDLDNIRRICHVGQDDSKAGEISSGLFDLILPRNSKVAIISDFSEFICQKYREEGFFRRLRSSGSSITVVESAENLGQDLLSFKLVSEICKKYPDLKGIYITGTGAEGLGKALKSSEMHSQVQVISHELSPSVIKLMEEGIVKFSICHNPLRQGSMAIQLLFKFVFRKIKPVNEKYYVEPDIITYECL